MSDGQSSESVWMGIPEEIEVVIRFPDQISGPPVGCRSAMKTVVMLRTMTDVQTGKCPFYESERQILEASGGTC